MSAPLAGGAPRDRVRRPGSAIAAIRVRDPDPADAATRLLASLAGEHDDLRGVCGAVADIAGAPAVVLYRRDGARVLLAHRHGDAALAQEAAGDAETGGDRLDGAGALGLPLELDPPAGDDPTVIRLHGRPFAALGVRDGLVALGPVGGRLRRRDLARLRRLGDLIDGAVSHGLAAAARQAELQALRSQVEMGRRALGSTIDEGRSFGLLLDLAMTSSGARAGLVAVRERGRLAIVAHRDLPPGVERVDLTPGAGILAEVPGIPGLLIVEGFETLSGLGLDGLLAVGGPTGAPDPEIVFGLVPTAGAPLPDDCAALLETIVDQAVLLRESGRATRAVAGRHLAALRGMCSALDARSAETRGHHLLVARAAGAIAKEIGLPMGERRAIVAAARVHDVGMLAADSTLAAEFAHPTLGADMAELVPGAAELAPLVRAHHEWFDGFGFPEGLAGEAIPRGARVLAAAEFHVESMQMAGPQVTVPWLVEEIRARRGTQLDPRCADAMLALTRA